MIISASRRTDIPAFYVPWFRERVRQGYCTVVNPFNRKQVTRVSLAPEDVDVFVFWTKNPAPLLHDLGMLDDLGYKYYFHYTLNAYPPLLEPGIPALATRLQTFRELAERIGPPRVIWRYDPIIFSNLTDAAFHVRQFRRLASELAGSCHRVVISFVDNYAKAKFKELAAKGMVVNTEPDFRMAGSLAQELAAIAGEQGLEIDSCAERLDLRLYGVKAGQCIGAAYLQRVFGLAGPWVKDSGQRQACGCVQSKDIGAYDTCLHACAYCYAGTLAGAKKRRMSHFPDSPSLLGRYSDLFDR